MRCPKCRSDHYSITCMGAIARVQNDGPPSNKVTCEKCGWKGLAKDMLGYVPPVPYPAEVYRGLWTPEKP